MTALLETGAGPSPKNSPAFRVNLDFPGLAPQTSPIQAPKTARAGQLPAAQRVSASRDSQSPVR